MHDATPPEAPIVRLDTERRRRRATPPPSSTAPSNQLARRRAGPLYRVAAFVVAAGAMTGLCASVGFVWGARGADPGALRTLARALPLAAGACAHLVVFAPTSLLVLTLVLGFVHLFDFWIGILCREPLQVGLPLVCGVLTLASAIPQVAEAALGSRRP